MKLRSHHWGGSASVDRVWSMVAGMPEGKAESRILMVLQAYFDDSYDQDPEGFYVLAGHISTAEKWADFSNEWEKMLEWGGTLDAGGKRHFKMSEMNHLPERQERVVAFSNVVREHALVSLVVGFRPSDLARARQRIVVDGYRNIDWGPYTNNFMTAYLLIIGLLMESREKFNHFIPVDEPIDVIFDSQGEYRQVWAGWDKLMDGILPDFKALEGGVPRFEDDKIFLPLQAADLLAWVHRKFFSERDDVVSLDKIRFLRKKCEEAEEKAIPVVTGQYSEDALVRWLIGGIRRNPLTSEKTIYDVRAADSGWSARVFPPTMRDRFGF